MVDHNKAKNQVTVFNSDSMYTHVPLLERIFGKVEELKKYKK